jgi:5-methylcytosine-specific restriction enzyme B
MERDKFPWTIFYAEFADKLMSYKSNRAALLEILENEYDALDMRYPFIEGDENLNDICPFTV